MKLSTEVFREDEKLDDLNDRGLNEWIEIATDTLNDRGFEYGDPRCNLLRIFRISRVLGVQLRDPSQLALVFIATKLSRMVESPEREDSYLDLIGYAAILARTKFTDWGDFESFEEH